MFTADEKLINHEIVEVCKRLYARNLLAAADGNVSYRLSDDRILITPSGMPKAFMAAEQMAIIDINGDVLHGNPSSEKLMHIQIYQSCPEARAVVHAHPPTAIAWTVAQPNLKKLPSDALSEVILAFGEVSIVEYARPGSAHMGEVLIPYLPEHKAMLLSRHGALCWGDSLLEAFMGMERVEHVSQILMSAKNLGGLTQLPEEEIIALKSMRKSIHPKIL